MGEDERQRAGGWGSEGEGERQRAGGWGSEGEGERQRAGGWGSEGQGEWRVLTALPHTSAVLLRGALRNEGIVAELERDGLAAVYGLDGGGFATRVVVPGGHVERARQVLSELESPT
jgi:hypothetical protein